MTQEDIEKVIREYLPELIHMSLATSKEGKPWVCEVHYAWDDELNLYFRSLASRRHCQEIAENPNVAGNIVKQHQPSQMPLGIYFEGTAKRLEPGDEQNKAFACIDGRFQKGPEILEEASRPDGNQFYKITVRNWYVFGALDGEKPQKYQLEWNK